MSQALSLPALTVPAVDFLSQVVKLLVDLFDTVNGRQLTARGVLFGVEPCTNAALAGVKRWGSGALALQASLKGSEPRVVLNTRIEHGPIPRVNGGHIGPARIGPPFSNPTGQLVCGHRPGDAIS